MMRGNRGTVRACTPKILVISASVGAGHNGAAEAVKEELLATAPAPTPQIEYRDALDFIPRWYRTIYAGGYRTAVTSLPLLYGLSYAVTDLRGSARRSAPERLRLGFERRMLDPLLTFIRQYDPDLIIHTHYLAPPAIAYGNRTGLFSVRQIMVTTDVDIHRFWYCEDIERWFAVADPAVKTLAQWGIGPERVSVSGMPVHPKWRRPQRQTEDVLADWSLPRRRIILLSGGAEFTCGPIVAIARRLARTLHGTACVVVAAGRNKKLLGRLSSLRETRERTIVPISFTDRLHELAGAADVVITKPGGMITAECIARSKPMIFISPVPGQEGINARYYVARSAAVVTGSTAELVSTACELFSNLSRLSAMSRAAGALHRDGAREIANYVLEHLG